MDILLSTTPEISVVIPAYNEAERIAFTLARTVEYLEHAHPSSEVIVVDDGSTDDTARLVAEFARLHPAVKLIEQPKNRGKGAAVRRGALETRGAFVLYMDADLSTPIEELEKLLGCIYESADVVIGSRGLPESDVRVRQPAPRELMGRTFNLLVRSLVLSGFKDTQCGFKLFTREAAQTLFPRQTLDGFAFDVELLLLANAAGLRIREIPIVWYNSTESKVSPVTHASRMFVDLLILRARRLRARRD